MANSKEAAAPAPRVNQEIPFDLKLDIESLNIKVSKDRKKRVNQKDLIIELIQIGIDVSNKKLSKKGV